MTKIDLITGILGSGKTTFIKKYVPYLLKKGERIAILENDFGAVNVDMMILQELKSENCTVEMIVGGGDHDCHRRRFKTQLIALGMQKFDRVIVEPSGIFDMDEFFDILYESPLDNWFTIGSVIGITDAETEEQLSDRMEYLLASESACCGKLLLSKADGMSGSEREKAAEKLINHINRSMQEIKCDRTFTAKNIIAKPWENLTEDDLLSLENSGYYGAKYVKKYSPEEIKSGVHYFMHIDLPNDKIGEVIDSIMHGGCGKVYRIKGSLPTENGGWLKINATRKKTELSPVSDGQAVLIVIGDRLEIEKIDACLKKYNRDSAYVSA